MKKKAFYLFFILNLSLFAQKPEEAYSSYREGDYEKAITMYQKLYEKSPVRQDYFRYLLDSYRQTGNFKAADALVDRQMKLFPAMMGLLIEKGYNLQLQHRQKEADRYYKKALQSVAEKPSYAYLVGQTFRYNLLYDKALETYQIAKKIRPGMIFNIQIAQIYAEQGEYEKMFESYLDLAEKDDKYLLSIKNYTSRYISADPENEVNILFKKILLKRNRDNPKSIYNSFLGWLYMQQNEFDKALIQEKAVYRRTQNNIGTIYQIGKTAFKYLDYDTADDAFRFVIENAADKKLVLQSEDYLIRKAIKTAQTEKDIKRIDTEFDKLFEKYGKNHATLDLQLTYADYLTYQAGKPQEAVALLEEAEKMAQTPFEKGAIKLKLGDVLLFTNKFNQALIRYSQVQTSLKNSVLAQNARFKVAETSYYKGDFEWAKTQLKILKTSTSQLIANDALDLYLKIINNIEKDSVTRPLKLLAKAELLQKQNKNTAAIDTLQRILETYKGHPVEDDALFAQAELYNRIKDPKAAEQNFIKLLKIRPKGDLATDTYFQLAQLYQQRLKEPEKAKTYYEKIIFEYPTSIYISEARRQFRLLRGDENQ